MNMAEWNAICQLITARYKTNLMGGTKGYIFLGVKVGFATTCKLQVVGQQVASPEKLYRIFMLGIFAFCSGTTWPGFAFCTGHSSIQIVFCRGAFPG